MSTLSAFPNLVNEFDYDKNSPTIPEDFTHGSTKKVWWRCSAGHEWEARVDHRVRGSKCHYCTGQKPLPENTIEVTHPHLVSQWSPTNLKKMSQVSFGSDYKAHWVCDVCGHNWTTAVRVRTKGHGCPNCANRETSIKRRIPAIGRSLAENNPELQSEWSTQNPMPFESVSVQSQQRAEWVCEKGHTWSTLVMNRYKGHGCPKCVGRQSAAEQELFEYVKTLDPDAVSSAKTILQNRREELDIYIPSRQVAIEYNGLYWHSEKMGKNQNYHRRKTDECLEANIQLIHIWEDDWLNKTEIIKKLIARKLGLSEEDRISARDCSPESLDFRSASDFLQLHHIQGSSPGTIYKGLRDPSSGAIVSVLVATRTGQPGEYRIDRYATSAIVRGGFSKLLRAAERDLDIKTWITFSDNSVSDGGLYAANGFKKTNLLRPDYSYVYKGSRRHKFNFRLSRFKADPELMYCQGMTEKELSDLNGLLRVWDAGKVKWTRSNV